MIDIGVNFINKRMASKQTALINQAKTVGVTGIIATGTTLSNSIKTADLVKKHKGYLYMTAGVHPHYASEWSNKHRETIIELAKNDYVVAIGECGLDFDRMHSPKEVQIDVFRKQLDIARELDLPVFLHERAAVEDFLKVFEDYTDLIERSIVHCFTGNKETLQKYLDLGFMIGITGWVADNRRGEPLREALQICPLDRICIETDAPFLTPHNLPHRPSHNEPKYLPYVAKKLAEVKGVDVEEVIERTKENTIRFFNLKR